MGIQQTLNHIGLVCSPAQLSTYTSSVILRRQDIWGPHSPPPPPTSLPGNVRVPQCDASQSLERKQRKCRGCWAAGSPPYCSIIFPKENFLTKRRDTFYRLPGTGRASRSVITDLDKTENDWECEAKTLSDWKCQCCDWTSVNLGLK